MNVRMSTDFDPSCSTRAVPGDSRAEEARGRRAVSAADPTAAVGGVAAGDFPER